jgi:hypothetical protein
MCLLSQLLSPCFDVAPGCLLAISTIIAPVPLLVFPLRVPSKFFFFLLEVLIGVRFASDTTLRYQKLACPIDVLLRYFTLAPIDLSHARNVRFARCVQSLEAGCRASSFIYFSALTCDCGETSLVQLPSISTTVARQSKPLSLLLRYLMIMYCCITIGTLTLSFIDGRAEAVTH